MPASLNGAFIGHDGWLFPAQEAQQLLELCQIPDHFHGLHVDRWCKALARRKATFAESRIPYLHAFVPGKVGLFPDRFPLPLRYPERSPAAMVSGAAPNYGMAGCVLDIGAALRDDPARASFVEPSGTGWTEAGSVALARTVLTALAQLFGTGDRALIGDAGLRAVLQAGGPAEAPANSSGVTTKREGENTICKTSRAILTNGELLQGSTFALVNPDAVLPCTLAVFGSPAVAAGQPAILDRFAAAFRIVRFVCSRDIDYSFVARADAAVVISLVVEHEMAHTPIDQYDIGVDEFWFNDRFVKS